MKKEVKSKERGAGSGDHSGGNRAGRMVFGPLSDQRAYALPRTRRQGRFSIWNGFGITVLERAERLGR
jgi:hypothetical protein